MNAIALPEDHLLYVTLKAAVIYDNFDFAARAAALLERAAMRTDEAMKWDVKPWRLDTLKQPVPAHAALGETIGADLIMIALCKSPSQLDELKNWLENWAMKRQTEEPAIMLFCPEGNAASMWLWYELKEFAEWHNLHFLGSRNLWDDGSSMDFVNLLWRRKLPPQPIGPIHEPFAESASSSRHWKINE